MAVIAMIENSPNVCIHSLTIFYEQGSLLKKRKETLHCVSLVFLQVLEEILFHG
jgi:hypothetical protein